MNTTQEIEKIKSDMGQDLVILAHHYQQDEIVRHADYLGDSLELARKISDTKAKYIVFCGVSFMAETAAILAKPEQKVFIPDFKAACDMAEMSQETVLENVLQKLGSNGRKIIPLAYVNTRVGIKAVCGRHNGSVCTSANAQTMLKWALQQGDAVLFLPDRNLGLNTADILGIKHSQRLLLDKNNIKEADQDIKLFLWPGWCYVHDFYLSEHVLRLREIDPAAKIVVHPESRPEVVQKCDGAGSTSFLIKYVQDAPDDSRIYVGTEDNLVRRLSRQYADKKHIFALQPTSCKDMNLITEAKLLATLNNLQEAPGLKIDMQVKEQSLVALQRMLEVCA